LAILERKDDSYVFDDFIATPVKCHQ